MCSVGGVPSRRAYSLPSCDAVSGRYIWANFVLLPKLNVASQHVASDGAVHAACHGCAARVVVSQRASAAGSDYLSMLKVAESVRIASASAITTASASIISAIERDTAEVELRVATRCGCSGALAGLRPTRSSRLQQAYAKHLPWFVFTASRHVAAAGGDYLSRIVSCCRSSPAQRTWRAQCFWTPGRRLWAGDARQSTPLLMQEQGPHRTGERRVCSVRKCLRRPARRDMSTPMASSLIGHGLYH